VYPLGVYLARYFDWWSDQVKVAPFKWLLGLLIGPVVLTKIGITLLGPLFVILGFAMVVAAIPGLLVGYVRLGIQFQKKREELTRLSIVQNEAKTMESKVRSKGR